MASTEGLTRRRGGPAAATDGDEDVSDRVASPTPKSAASYNDRTPETSYSSGENGHKIAFDPRDISESEERSKQPKLTLMEEILLLGLKDKQVRPTNHNAQAENLTHTNPPRVTCRSGTITYHTPSEDA